MKANLSAFAIGLLFALGLGISGMTHPVKVIGFLDFFGAWDPTLALVMAGALAIYIPGYTLLKRRKESFLHLAVCLPSRKQFEPSLIVGSLLFGVGWGLAGYCPGPALVSLPAAYPGLFVFVAAMLAGMALARKAL